MRRIIADPEILGGKPVVEGTRLSVDHILGLLSHGMSHAEIVEAYIDRILLGYPMRQVAEPVICRGVVTAESLAQCEELGLTLAAGLAFGIF
jgi:hypothetical protein